MKTLWTERYAQRTQRLQSSAIRELLKLTEQPEKIVEGIRRLGEVLKKNVRRSTLNVEP